MGRLCAVVRYCAEVFSPDLSLCNVVVWTLSAFRNSFEASTMPEYKISHERELTLRDVFCLFRSVINTNSIAVLVALLMCGR